MNKPLYRIVSITYGHVCMYIHILIMSRSIAKSTSDMRAKFILVKLHISQINHMPHQSNSCSMSSSDYYKLGLVWK